MKNESKAKKLVAVTLGAVMTFSLVACGGNGGGEASHNHTYSNIWAHTDTHHYHEATCGHDVKPEDSDGYAKHIMQNGECTVCDYVASITLAEFVSDYKTKAQNFVNINIRPIVVGDKEVKAEQWYIVGNSNNALSEVNIVYTYTVNSTDRKIEIASAKPTTPIPFKDIVDNNYTINASALEIDRTNAFTFNAETNYNKQELSSALFAKAGIKTSDLYPNTIYKEIESTNESTRSFELLEQSNGKITIKTIATEKGNGSDSDLLDYLYGPKTKVTDSKTYEIDGTSIYNSTYTLENLGQEEEKPDDGDDDGDDDDDDGEPITNAEIIAALDRYYRPVLLQNCFNFAFDIDLNCIEYGIWYVETDIDNKIISVEYVSVYRKSNTANYFTIGKIEFIPAISTQDLKNGKVDNATYTRPYRFDFNPTIQTDRAALTNAICDKLLGTNANCLRYLYHHIWSTEFEQAERFSVMQLTERDVQEISIRMECWHWDSPSTEEYIKLFNTSTYSIYGEKSYTISGVKVENNNSPFTTN